MKNVLKNHHSGLLQQQLLQQLLSLSRRHSPLQSQQLFQCSSKKFLSSNSHRIKPKEKTKVALIQGEGENYYDDELIQAESDLTTTTSRLVPPLHPMVHHQSGSNNSSGLAWSGTKVDVKTSMNKEIERKVTSAASNIPFHPSTHVFNDSNTTTAIQQGSNNNTSRMTVAKSKKPIVTVETSGKVYSTATANDPIADEKTTKEPSFNINIEDKVSLLQFIHHHSSSHNTISDSVERKVRLNKLYQNRNWWPSMACEFGYKPEEWCNAFPIAVNGTRQSPIDISSSTCQCLSTENSSLDLKYPQVISGLEVKNTGHGWVVNIPGDVSRNTCEC